MADGDYVKLNKATIPNGDNVAVDRINSLDYQRIKLVHGPSGSIIDGDVQHENPLPVLPGTHMYSKGVITGHESLRKFGINTAVPTTEVFLEVGVTTETAPYLPTTATTVRIKAGGNAADTAAGAGAQSVIVYGVDDTWTRTSETIVTAGASASAVTTTTFLRVDRAVVGAVGTYGGANTGAITIESSGGTRFITIAAGRGQSQATHYAVGSGHGLFLKDIHITTETAKSSTIRIWQLQSANDVTTPFSPKRIVHEYIGVAGSPDFEYTPDLYFPAYTDVWATGVVSAATGAIAVEFNGILEVM